MLHDLVACVRFRPRVYDDWGFAAKDWRGLGVTALFSGVSGTGKTLAAEVVANDLRLDLYRIDLSGVVSKYIGETEKNLRRVFDAAEESGSILLFDEADALFGKRSDVKDSHDRYANIEVSYLLQRMEAYRGVAILTTNARESLDNAFLRRIRFAVQFPFPGPEERREIWRRIFPEALPTSNLSIEKLARLNLDAAKVIIAQGVEGVTATTSVKDVQDLIALRTKYAESGVQTALVYSKSLYEMASEAQAQYSALAEEAIALTWRRVIAQPLVEEVPGASREGEFVAHAR